MDDDYLDALRDVAAALRARGLYPEGEEPETAEDVARHVVDMLREPSR